MSAEAAEQKTSPLSAEAMQYEVDRAAHFNMFSIPDEQAGVRPIQSSGGTSPIIGYEIRESLHRFEIASFPPDGEHPVRARNSIGERAGVFRHRWMFTPDDYCAIPDREPPATPLIPSRARRFVMMDSVCTFSGEQDGFRGFGSGQLLPIGGSEEWLVTAIGTITAGFGRFAGHEEGTYVYCGAFDPGRGFTGNVLLRVMDSPGVLQTERELREMSTVPNPSPDVVYLLLRGQAVPSDAVTPAANGLTVDQGIRLLHLDFDTAGRRGIGSTSSVGPLVGKVTAHVSFDPASPGGGLLDPIPFTSFDEFVIHGPRGERSGAFTATSTEGRVFHTLIGGQPGLRFGGTGALVSGTGTFQDVKGLMTDNSTVLFAPHVSASIYVLRLDDPQGRFRAS